VNSPWASSVGRLFDAVASLTGLRQRVSFEGQAAMELEFAVGSERAEHAYRFRIVDHDEPSAIDHRPAAIIIDWEPMVWEILDDVKQRVPVSVISAKFHNTLTEIIVHVAKRIGEERVVLTGGCFQNRLLTERTVRRLEAEGFRPYWHQRIPPNDGGIALGQVFAACRAAGRTKPGAADRNLRGYGLSSVSGVGVPDSALSEEPLR